MRATILCVLLSAVAISADLKSDIDEVVHHLPIEKMEQLGQKYLATYPSIRPALIHLQSLSNEEIIEKYVSKDLIEYFNRHGIDGRAVFLQMIGFSKEFHRKLLQQQPTEQVDPTVPEITGDSIADLRQLIASSDVLDVIQKKLETSPEFANFIAAVKEPEFKALFFRNMNSNLSNGKNIQMRGWFSNVWKKVKKFGVGISVAIPFGK